MSKITIQAVKNEDKVSANGKAYTRCSIKTVNTKGEEVWLSGFGNNTTKSYTKGQVVDLDIYSEDYNGKTYYKFKEVAERNVFSELDEIKAILKHISASITTGLPLAPKNAVEAKFSPTEPIGEYARDEEPTAEQLDAMFSNPNRREPEPIRIEDIKF